MIKRYPAKLRVRSAASATQGSYPAKLRVRCASSAIQRSYVYAVRQALPREATCMLCGVFLLVMEHIRLKDPVVEKGSTWIAVNFC